MSIAGGNDNVTAVFYKLTTSLRNHGFRHRSPGYGGSGMNHVLSQPARDHRHVEVKTLVLLQRGGVPYEVEQKVCFDCQRVLDERPLRRAAA